MSSYSELANTIIQQKGQGGKFSGLNQFLDVAQAFKQAQQQYQMQSQLKQQENFSTGAAHIIGMGAMNGMDVTPQLQEYAQITQPGSAANIASGNVSLGEHSSMNSTTGSTSLPGFKGVKQQDALEKQYADRLDKVLSNRSGGLGMMDAKVNQAILARQLLDQYYDPKTKEYNVPQAQYTDLAISLATLLAPNTQASDSKVEAIRQRTAQGDFNGMLSYITGAPKNATTSDMVKNLADSIDREGLRAEANREKYLTNLRGQFPTNLNKDTQQRLEANSLANSFKEYLSKPIMERTNPEGLSNSGNTSNSGDNSQLQSLKAKYGLQ